MKKAIRILLVDDHELVRHGLRHMLELEEDIEVVGDYSGVEEAFPEMARLSPDIILMDAEMPGVNGIDATRSLKRNGLNYDGDVIVLAESVDYRAEAVEAGAASYLLKDITRAELTQAVREVYWSKQSPEGREGFVNETVELVIPPPANATWLLRFMCQLEERLHGNHASIMHTVGSWHLGTIITISLKPTALSGLLYQLGNMPEVQKVEEKGLARDVFSSFSKKFGILSRLSSRPSKRISITLKETSTARQESATVSN